MIAVDTSIAVAAFASWHAGHASAVDTLRRGARLLSHVAIETYSVLTRLPPPYRADPVIVRDFLAAAFSGDVLSLSPAGHTSLLDRATLDNITGGAVYDALVAATATEAGLRLVSRDMRAARTYEAMEADFELID